MRKASRRGRRMSTRPSRLSLPSSQATASAKARWISRPMIRMVAPPSLFVQGGSWRATRHLLIRAHGASGVARGGYVTSSGSQPTVYRRPARTFVLPAPRVPDGLTITPAPFREQADSKAPTDHIPDNGQVERMNRTMKTRPSSDIITSRTASSFGISTTSSPPTTSPEGSAPPAIVDRASPRRTSIAASLLRKSASTRSASARAAYS